MKVFGCTMMESYSGGIILVAANSIEEAYQVAAREYDLYFDWRDAYGNRVERHTPDAKVTSTYYPFEEWKEYEHLSCDYTDPQVILEESYAE